MIKVFSEKCFQTDYKTAWVFSPLQQAHHLTRQYMNPERSMNAFCTLNLGSVSVG